MDRHTLSIIGGNISEILEGETIDPIIIPSGQDVLILKEEARRYAYFYGL